MSSLSRDRKKAEGRRVLSRRSREEGHRPDYVMMVTVFLLLVVGFVVLSSASAVQSFEDFGSNYYYFRHQLLYGGLFGLIAWGIGSRVKYTVWRRYALWGMVATILLLIAVFLPGLGFSHGGAQRWIVVGPVSLQPAEIAKLAVIIYLAAWFESRAAQIRDVKLGLAPFLALMGVIGVLILAQPDTGTLGVIVMSSMIMYFVAGASLVHMGGIGLGMVALLGLLVKVAPYRAARLTVFLNPESDVQGIGYQINQALIAVGSGGFLGLGLGKSRQKFSFLPEATGDSIFAIIGEELGLIGALFVVGLFVVFMIRGIRIARLAPDVFSRLVAVGVTAWITLQALVNIGAILSLIPLTGIPLPFISYGGSAMMFSLFAVGILTNISRYTTEEVVRDGGGASKKSKKSNRRTARGRSQRKTKK